MLFAKTYLNKSLDTNLNLSQFDLFENMATYKIYEYKSTEPLMKISTTTQPHLP